MTSKTRILLAGLAGGLGLGVALGWTLHPSPGPHSATHVSAPESAAARCADPAGASSAPSAMFQPPEPAAPGPTAAAEQRRPQPDDATRELEPLARRDPLALAELVYSRYGSETELDLARWLEQMIRAAHPSPEIEPILRLVSSRDPRVRRIAYELAEERSLDVPALRDTLLEALGSERDPAALASAARAARPALLPDADVRRFSDRFRSLLHHEDPEIRGESIVQLVAWDRGSPEIANVLEGGLRDASPEVRNSALSAIDAAHLEQAPVRESVWAIANDPQQPFETRQRAVELLARAPLSEERRLRLGRIADDLAAEYSSAEAEGPP